MGNASKALLMATGILVAIIIISIAVYLFITYRNVASTYEESVGESEITEFNNNFTKFKDREDITAHEIVTLINYINEGKYNTEVEVTINGGTSIVEDGVTLSNNLEIKYKEDGIFYNFESGKVSKINFKK